MVEQLHTSFTTCVGWSAREHHHWALEDWKWLQQQGLWDNPGLPTWWQQQFGEGSFLLDMTVVGWLAAEEPAPSPDLNPIEHLGTEIARQDFFFFSAWHHKCSTE